LPVQRPLIINLATAKALGLTVPQSMIARADCGQHDIDRTRRLTHLASSQAMLPLNIWRSTIECVQLI
jgi:hypothetical protein